MGSIRRCALSIPCPRGTVTERACGRAMNEATIRLRIEKLADGCFLATSADVPDLVADESSVAETTELAQGLARKIAESCIEHGDQLPAALAESGRTRCLHRPARARQRAVSGTSCRFPAPGGRPSAETARLPVRSDLTLKPRSVASCANRPQGHLAAPYRRHSRRNLRAVLREAVSTSTISCSPLSRRRRVFQPPGSLRHLELCRPAPLWRRPGAHRWYLRHQGDRLA